MKLVTISPPKELANKQLINSLVDGYQQRPISNRNIAAELQFGKKDKYGRGKFVFFCTPNPAEPTVKIIIETVADLKALASQGVKNIQIMTRQYFNNAANVEIFKVTDLPAEKLIEKFPKQAVKLSVAPNVFSEANKATVKQQPISAPAKTRVSIEIDEAKREEAPYNRFQPF
jgi:hypothetical protein